MGCSGSVGWVLDSGSSGSSLTFCVLEQDTLSPAKYSFNPGRPALIWLKNGWLERKESNQTNKSLSLSHHSWQLLSAISLRMYFGGLYHKQYEPRSDCSLGSSLIRVHCVCLRDKISPECIGISAAEVIRRWKLSGRLLDSRQRGCMIKPHQPRCVVSFSKTYKSLLSTGFNPGRPIPT